jgi:hypothetical protein
MLSRTQVGQEQSVVLADNPLRFAFTVSSCASPRLELPKAAKCCAARSPLEDEAQDGRSRLQHLPQGMHAAVHRGLPSRFFALVRTKHIFTGDPLSLDKVVLLNRNPRHERPLQVQANSAISCLSWQDAYALLAVHMKTHACSILN